MMTHAEMVNQMLQNPQVRTEYEALEPEFALLDELLRARQRAGLTPTEVAHKIGTPLQVITKLETGISEKYSPTVTTLRKYAEAVGCRLEIKLVPRFDFSRIYANQLCLNLEGGGKAKSCTPVKS